MHFKQLLAGFLLSQKQKKKKRNEKTMLHLHRVVKIIVCKLNANDANCIGKQVKVKHKLHDLFTSNHKIENRRSHFTCPLIFNIFK